MSHDTGFLDANLIRYFPFVANDEGAVPNWLVVDFRAEIRSGTWDPEVHRIYLAWITRLGSRIRFGLRTDAPELADQELVFERDLSDMKFRSEHVRSTALLETLESRCGCSTELLCNSGFGTAETCGEQLCNPNLDADCQPEHVCNPVFEIDDPVGFGVDNLLLESGGNLLLESGGVLRLE